MQGTEPLQLTVNYQGEEQTHEVTWEEGAFLIDGQDHYLPMPHDYCHVHRNQVQVVHENLRYEFSLPDHEAKAVGSNANAIYAPMPGKIIAILMRCIAKPQIKWQRMLSWWNWNQPHEFA